MMEEREHLTSATRPTYTEEARELAFELWFFRFSRSHERTAAYLREHLPECATITGRTIGNWSRQLNWDDEANERLRQAAPSIHASIVHNLIYAASAGSEFIRRVNEGDPATRVNGRVDQGAVLAANSALAKAGFADRVNRDQTGVLDPPQRPVAQIDIAHMSPDDLSQLQRQQVIEAQTSPYPSPEPASDSGNQ